MRVRVADTVMPSSQPSSGEGSLKGSSISFGWAESGVDARAALERERATVAPRSAVRSVVSSDAALRAQVARARHRPEVEGHRHPVSGGYDGAGGPRHRVSGETSPPPMIPPPSDLGVSLLSATPSCALASAARFVDQVTEWMLAGFNFLG